MTKGDNIAWEAVKEIHAKGNLSDLHERLYFQTPRPIFELYDLETDPYQLTNLSGDGATAKVEENLRSRLDRWMVQESDYLPLPSHISQIIKKQSRTSAAQAK